MFCVLFNWFSVRLARFFQKMVIHKVISVCIELKLMTACAVDYICVLVFGIYLNRTKKLEISREIIEK